MYFKITNEKENHYGFQYQDGLNILIEEFNDNPNDSCCKGGFYFTNSTNILKFLGYGIYLREVTLPTNNKDFKMLKDKEGDKWRSNMIILGKRYDLSSADTFKFLVEQGADLHAYNDLALSQCAISGYLDVVKFLVESKHPPLNVTETEFSLSCKHLPCGTDMDVNKDLALRWSAEYGQLEIVKFLVEIGANIHADGQYALELSARTGHLNVVKFLVENGANIHADDDLALKWSAEKGHIDVVMYLVENGANIHANNNYALRCSTTNGHTNVTDFLFSKGATLKN